MVSLDSLWEGREHRLQLYLYLYPKHTTGTYSLGPPLQEYTHNVLPTGGNRNGEKKYFNYWRCSIVGWVGAGSGVLKIAVDDLPYYHLMLQCFKSLPTRLRVTRTRILHN